MLVVPIVLGVLWACLARQMAEKRGRSVRLWFAMGFLFGLVAILVLACIGKKEVAEIQHAPVAYPSAA